MDLVVGSGPNGLAAAITLARAGRSVTVLEAAPAPGGAVRTESLTLPGFAHDTFSAVYPAGAASPVFAALPLARHGLRWCHPDACFAHPLTDGTGVALYRSLEATADSLEVLGPGDGERWRSFAAPYVEHADALARTLLAGFPPVRGPMRMLAGAGPAAMARLAITVGRSAESVARGLFRSAPARAWLYGSALHGDVPLDRRGSAIAGLYLNLLGHSAGWPSPEGGAQRLTDALIAHLTELGGSVRCDAQVTEVTSARRRVTGLRLAGGEVVAGEIVVADVMPAALAQLAGAALGDRFAAALRRYRPGPPTIKVDWALSGPIPWTYPQARRAGTVHLGGGEAALLNPLGAAPFVLLGQQSIADPSRAPAGRHTAWAYTHGAPGAAGAELGPATVRAMEAMVEDHAPGFTGRILARHVLDPAGLQARNANLAGGDVGGGSYALDQLLMRPGASPVPYRTPVRGLYLGSAATFPGAAVHGVCGHAAARLALAEARIRRWV